MKKSGKAIPFRSFSQKIPSVSLPGKRRAALRLPEKAKRQAACRQKKERKISFAFRCDFYIPPKIPCCFISRQGC